MIHFALKLSTRLRKALRIVLLLLVLGASASLVYFQTACGNSGTLLRKVFTYAYAAPLASDQRGTCQVKYETYELSGNYVTVPSKGNKEHSQDFEGYDVYEYLYPANPEKNDDKRKKLYSFNKNGSVEVYGNTVVQGDRTQLYNEFSNGSIGIANQQKTTTGKTNTRHFIQLEPRKTDARMNGGAEINNTWNPYDKSGLGPSVFFNPNASKLEMEEAFMVSDSKKDAVIDTSLMDTASEYYWYEYLSGSTNVDSLELASSGPFKIEINKDRELQNATAMFYKAPIMYIADMGKRRIVGYEPERDEFISLGKGDWNWLLAGITVDDDRTIYVTDTAMDTIIKTKITGQGWEESYKDLDNYQSRLFLDGSENYRALGIKGSYARDVTVNDCGYNSHEVVATSSSGRMSVDPATGKPTMMSTTDCAFGNECYAFNGQEHLDLKDNAAWNFGDDYFTIDLWAKFDSIDKTVALISHPDAYLFEWTPNKTNPAAATNPAETKLVFAFINSNRDANGQYTNQTFEHNWFPEVGEWYHLSIVRERGDYLTMYVDGKMLGQPVKITGELLDGTIGFQVGGYLNRKEMIGQIDNVRVARGPTDWSVDYSFRYEFNDPKGIIIVGDYLYIVDSGNGRIVKMSKDFKEWWTFGTEGSGNFQFLNPTDIYYDGGNFYITDTGNSRVVKTNMAQMVYYLKGESGGSWEVIYSSDSPGLHGVLAKDGSVFVTDSYNGNIVNDGFVIGAKNPWNNLFKFTNPVDIQLSGQGFYILDGVSNYDFSTHVGDRSMDLYGTSQKEGINTRFNTGGMVAGEKARVQGVIAKLNYDDWYRWIGDEQGPGVALCPLVGNSSATLHDGRCSNWSGEGQNVDCSNGGSAPPSECVGQWDWEIHWPYCISYVPSYEVVRVCDGASYCNDSATTTPDGTNPGDYECGCNDYHNDCFSYCIPEEHECHEGYAVAYEFVESGPPWYAAAEPEVDYIPEGECRPASGYEFSDAKSGLENSVFGDGPGSWGD